MTPVRGLATGEPVTVEAAVVGVERTDRLAIATWTVCPTEKVFELAANVAETDVFAAIVSVHTFDVTPAHDPPQALKALPAEGFAVNITEVPEVTDVGHAVPPQVIVPEPVTEVDTV